MKPLVSAVVPTLNRKDDLLHCIESVIDSSYENIEIIVVDNASTDGTGEAVRQLYPNVKLVRLGENTGVTGGRNVGARMAKGEFILFLDHDMIVDKELVKNLVNALKSKSVGAAGSIIYYFDEPKKIWAAGTSINMLTGKISFNNIVIDDRAYAEVQVLPAAIMVRREVLEKVGLFDGIFFAVYEDTDFCFRVKEAGYKVVCVPNAKAWHKVPVDEKLQELHVLSRSYYIARNRIIFMKKHASRKNLIIFLTFFVPIYVAYYTWRSLRRWKFRYGMDYWKGVLDGIREILKK